MRRSTCFCSSYESALRDVGLTGPLLFLVRCSGVPASWLDTAVRVRLEADAVCDDVARDRRASASAHRKAAGAGDVPRHVEVPVDLHVPRDVRARRIYRRRLRVDVAGRRRVDRLRVRVHDDRLRCRDRHVPAVLDPDEGRRRLAPKSAEIEAVAHVVAAEAPRLLRRGTARERRDVLLREDCQPDVARLWIADDGRRPVLETKPPQLRDRNGLQSLAGRAPHLHERRRGEIPCARAVARPLDRVYAHRDCGVHHALDDRPDQEIEDIDLRAGDESALWLYSFCHHSPIHMPSKEVSQALDPGLCALRLCVSCVIFHTPLACGTIVSTCTAAATWSSGRKKVLH